MTQNKIFIAVFLFFAGVFLFQSPVFAQALPTETPTPTETATPIETPTPNAISTVLAPIVPVLQPGILPGTSTPAPGTPGTPLPGTISPGTGIPGTGTPGSATPPAATPTNNAADTPGSTPTASTNATPSPVAPTSTPIPAIIEVHPRVVAAQFIQSGLIGVLGLGIALLVQRVTFRVLAGAHPEIRVFTARFLFIVIIIATALRILTIFDVNAATLATVLGSLGLALSLSAQDLFKNLIAGVYLLIEHPFVVGDVITIGSYTGQVLVVDMRTITLRTAEQELVIVPNTLVMSQVVVRKPNAARIVDFKPPANKEPPE